ncbi:MAG: TonB-dependent receptor [Acidobacteriota bacterium]
MLTRSIALPLLFLFLTPGLSAQEELVLPALSDDEAPAELSDDEPGSDDDLDAGSGVRVATTCTNCNAATLTMNGLSGDHVSVTWDGLPSTGGLATVYYLTQVPEDLLGHVEVHRGPGSVLTGSSALGGELALHSARKDRSRLFVRTELGSRGWQQLLAGGTERKGRFGGLVLVQAARSQSWDANDDGFNDVARFERFTYHGSLDIDLGDRQTLTLGANFYGEDQVEGPGRPVDFRELYLHEDAFLNWRDFSVGWKLERPDGLRVAADARWSRRSQQQWSPIDVGFDDDLTFAIEDIRWMGRVTLETPLGAASWLSAGLSWEEIELGVRQTFILPGQAGFIEDGLRHRAAWAQVDRSVGTRWDWTLGARVDDYRIFGRSEALFRGELVEETEPTRETAFLSPRASVSFRPSDGVALTLATGRGTIGPRPTFEQTCCGARYQRSLDLEPERAWSSELRLDWQPHPRQRISATAFRTDFRRYHERIVYQSLSGIPYYKKAALPRARLQGLDLIHDLRFAQDRLTVGWTYTYTDSEVREALTIDDIDAAEEWQCREVDPGDVPAVLDEEGSPLRYTPRHAGSVYLRWDDQRRGRKIGLDLSYTGSLRHFRLGEPGTGAADLTRLPCQHWSFLASESFWTADLSFEQRLGRSSWTLHAAVDNVFDYVMPDLGELDSAWDWGPLQGRFFRIGATWRPTDH